MTDAEIGEIYAECDQYNRTHGKIQVLLDSVTFGTTKKGEPFTRLFVSDQKQSYKLFLFGDGHYRFRHLMVPMTLLNIKYLLNGDLMQATHIEFLWPGYEKWWVDMAAKMKCSVAEAKLYIPQLAIKEDKPNTENS